MQLSRALSSPGQEKIWWDRLKAALGTTSSDFVNATLKQIQGASRLPSGELSETSVNAVLAFIEGADPKNEVEAALAIQMACLHAVTMTVLTWLGGGGGTTRNTAMTAAAAARLTKAFAAQAETLRRLKNGTAQFVRVEHVHVTDGSNHWSRCRRREAEMNELCGSINRKETNMGAPSESQRRAEIAQILRFLEHGGYLESSLGDDGKMYWRRTQKFGQWPDADEYRKFRDTLV